MSVVPLAVEIISAGVLAAFLLHRYGNWRKQHLAVTLAAFVSWYFSFLIIVILPLDVSSTVYRQCREDQLPDVSPATVNFSSTTTQLAPLDNSTAIQRDMSNISIPEQNDATSTLICQKPWSYVPPYILPTLWRVVYWTSQVLTWLILPMMQSYATAGDFTVAGKMRSALIENAIYYGSYLIIFTVCLIYVAVRPDLHVDGSQLKVLAITASNTWGLFLLVLLLGYGLVEIPRTLWNNSKKGLKLSLTYFKIAKLSTEKSEAEENLEDVLDDVKKAADTIKYTHALRSYVDTILLKCPDSVQNSVKRNKDDYEDYNNPTETPTEKSLVRLHKSVIKASQSYRRTQCQWNMLMEEAFDLEDIALNEVSAQHKYVRSFGKYDGIFTRCYNPIVEWYWKCWVRPITLKVLSVILVVFSFMVVWSECLFFVADPTLSLFALFVDLAKKNYDYFYIELASGMTIAYLAVTAYYTVFKIRIFNYYYIAGHHQTDENSLIFCGMLLCRLTPPLCLNFLGLIHLDGHVTKESSVVETAYTDIMGHMDVISFISDGFNIYFPILVVLLCLATYFRLGSRILHFLGFEQFIGDDEMTAELTDEGKELVKRERRRRQRLEDGQTRRRNWMERFGDNTAYHDEESDSGGKRRPGALFSAIQKNSRDDNDRMELLQQTEPIDFTPDAPDDFDQTSAYNMNNSWEAPSASRSQAYSTRPSRYGSASTSRPAVPPPKSIFDDV